MDEKEITLTDVLGFVAGFIIAVSGIVALFSLIWAAWRTFQVSLTVIASVCIIVAAYCLYNDFKKGKE